jgi:dihydroneopterin aldolase
MKNDIIRINNMIFYAHHGYYKAERELGQRFELDVELHTSFDRAMMTDELHDTINFEDVFEEIQNVFANTKFALLETVGGKIIERLFEKFRVSAIRLRIRKPQVPIRGILDNVEIEIFREKA